MGISNTHDAIEGEERRERETARAYAKLVRKLDRLTCELEIIGFNDMGILHQDMAGRFHDATTRLRDLVRNLQHDAYWPGEVTK